MKRLLLVVILLCLLTALFCLAAYADYAVITNTSSLNLRSGPGYEYGIIGKATRDEWVDIQNELGEWDYVTVVRTGKSGYMVDGYLKRGSSGGADLGIVNSPAASGFLNLREYPSYSAKVLGTYYNGTVCHIISHLSGWYFVEIDGVVGYFRQEYLIVTGGTAARVSAANGKPVKVRSGPAMNCPVADQLNVGTEVLVLLKGSGFWQISYSGMTGFMSSAFLKESGSGGSGHTPVTNGYLIVNSANGGKVNLRSQPSSTAKVLTKCQNGTRLEVIEGGLEWCKVYYKSSSMVGYMMTRFTTVYGLPGTPTKKVSNGKNYVNLRNAPSSSYGKVLSRVNSGEKVVVLIPGDEWTRVRYGNLEGYMMTNFLK